MEEIRNDAGGFATCEVVASPSGTPMFKLAGELDISSVNAIRAMIVASIANSTARVVIDLSDLRFIDSSGLSLLLGVADQVAEVELRDPSAAIRKVIDITGLSSEFVITP
jgi:anti-anti-sigma factor